MLKFDKYYPNVEVNKCFNDILGIRIILNSYKSILEQNLNAFKVDDMINGKDNDDGYRGLHLYYQKSINIIQLRFK